MAIGRISGPLLKANLLREGVDLAFETDLLYLDVVNARIGIKTTNPQYDLDVNGTTKALALEVSSTAQIADVNITSNTISSTASNGVLTLGTADNVVYQRKAVIDSITLENNVISTSGNENIAFAPDGTGSVEIFANTNVYGDIVATGSIIADGNITIGDANTDNVIFNAEVASDIVPDVNNTYNLGTPSKQWLNTYVENLFANSVEVDSIVVDDVDLTLRQGNIFYVATNGNDAYSGTHQNDPYASVEFALSQATAGDTVHVYPGTYEESFPLTIPVGVTLIGHSLRSVAIVPTVATEDNDAILLNGECSIEGLTLKNFYNGYGFRFSPGFKVTTRSPYIKNITVITKGKSTSLADPRGFDSGDAGGGAYIDGSVAVSSSKEASALFHSVTFITPGVNSLVITNGSRVEWLNCFTYFADKGLYLLDGTAGLKSDGETALRVTAVTGTISVGETITYYDSDGVTILATSEIKRIDNDDKFYIAGKQPGFEEFTSRLGKTVNAFNQARLDTTKKKFGSASLELSSTGDYVSIQSNNDFGFETSDWTVEGSFNPSTTASQEILFDFRAGVVSDNAVLISSNANNKIEFTVNGTTEIVSTNSIIQNSWNHIAVSRNSTSTRLFLNGALQGTFVDAIDYGTAKPLVVGSSFSGTVGFTGWIDEIRISAGIARYTSAFAVPTGSFSSDFNTVMLLHFDGDDSSVTIEDDANQLQDIRFSNGGTAKFITLADFTDFGGELRSISSACVYGNYGAYGTGPGVIAYLISQNFAYIGNGKNDDNDNQTVIQANEVVELNRAKIRYSSVDHNGDFRVGDSFYVNQQTGEVFFTSANLNIDTSTGISITTNGSTTNITGEFIDTGNLRIAENTVSSVSGDIILDADSGTVRINSTGALTLPAGTTAERPVAPEAGMIRYNTDVGLYEGYDGNWTALNGVYDLDLNTRVTAELTPGANDNIIRFYIEDVERLFLDSNKLQTSRIVVDDISIDGNTIATESTNTDLVLSANGTGAVVIDELAFTNSTITNRTPDGVMTFDQLGTGYFKISGTSGFVVPTGTNFNRPPTTFSEVGLTRFNIELRVLEVWDGFTWVSAAGNAGGLSVTQAEDIALGYILILG